MLSRVHNYIISKPVTTIVLFGLFCRLFIIALYSHVTIFPDSEGYTHLAGLLLDLNINGYEGTRSPGYPLLLALAGNYLPLVVVYQMVLGAVTAVYVYKTMRLLQFGKGFSIYTTLLLNSMVHVIFYETNILTETLTLFLMTLCFYCVFKLLLVSKIRFKDVVVTGVLLGLLTLVKPFYVFLPFLIYGLYTLKNFSIERIFNPVAFVVVLPVLSFLGWSYVNKVNTGHFVSTTFYGYNLAQNCVHFAENTPEEYHTISTIYVKHRELALQQNKDVAMTIWYAHDEMIAATGLSFIDLSVELGKFSKDAIKLNPLQYCRQVLFSWVDFWKTTIYWNYSEFNFKYANTAMLLVWYVESFILQLLKIVFVLTIPYHLLLFIRQRKITPQVIICSIVFVTSLLQAMATYGTNSRFSYPFEFLMIISLLLTFKPWLQRLADKVPAYKVN